MKAMEGWDKEFLGRVARLTMGQSPDSKYYSEEENGLPFLQGCAEFKGRFPKHSSYCSQTRKIANVGSILFSVRAPVGRINIADRDYIIGRGLAGISGIEVDQTYLEHYRTFVEPRFRNASQGSTFEAINSSELNRWPIEYPSSKPEQAKIAEILSTVDRAIEQTEALIAKQQRIKTGLMQDLLTRGIDEHGNLRSEKTHKFKDSLLGRIPVEWEVADFESRIESSAFGPRFPATAYSEQGNLAMLRTTDLDQSGNIAYGQMPRANLEIKAFKPHFLKQGDFLITRSGTIGIPAVFSGFDVPVIPGAFLIRFRMKQKAATSAYWRAYFNWEKGGHRLVSQSEGGVQKNLRGSSVNKMHMAFPQVNEQKDVVSILDGFDSDIQIRQRYHFKLHSVKTALMQDLLTGKKRVTHLLEAAEKPAA
jgi:type I restriction enzyme S subunit